MALISFAVCTHNEGEYVQTLMNQLVPFCIESGDEIVILDDFSIDDITNSAISFAHAHPFVQLHHRQLNKDFATHKNYLNSKCSGEYIFQIDADETLHPNLLESLHPLLRINKLDLFAIPRVNIVNGLTDEDIARWGWRVNPTRWVMFPDYQTRLYRNSPEIRWEGKVHERIIGHKTMAALPKEEEWALYHIKDIDRQRKQNEFYTTI